MSSRIAVALAISVLAATGCTPAVDGAAARAPVSIGPEGVDLLALDPGDYPTVPAPPYGTAGSTEEGLRLEGARLADYVVLPSDIGRGLTQLDTTATSLLVDSAALAAALTDHAARPVEIADAAVRHRFVVGFSSGRTESGGGPSKLTNAVLVFPDDAAAVSAAIDMAEVSDSGRAITLAGHGSTLGFLAEVDGSAVVTAFTPYGRYVLLQWLTAPETAELAVDAVARTLDAQKPLLGGFEPTAPEALAQLPVDASGVLARTILIGDAKTTTVEDLAFGPAGALHMDSNPSRLAGLYDQLLVDGVVFGDTALYQSNRHDGGRLLSDALAEGAVEDYGFSPAAGIPNLTAGRCFSREVTPPDGPYTGYYCVAMSGRWAFEAASRDEQQLHQLMSAQFMILAA